MDREAAVRRRGSLRTELATVAAALVVAGTVGALHLVNYLLEAGGTPRATTPAAEAAPAGAGQALDPRVDTWASGDRVCLPSVGRGGAACGVAPPAGRVGGHTAYRVTTVAGRSFWVIWPDDLAPAGSVVAVPRVPLGGLGEAGRSPLEVTTEAPHEVVARMCPSTCDPAPIVRRTLSNGAVHTGWRLAPGQAVEVVTVQMGHWVLAVREGAVSVTEFVAETLRWGLDRGFLLLEGPDPTYPVYADWAGVRVVADGGDEPYSLTITPGCELSKKRPPVRRETGPELRVFRSRPGGSWCAGGELWVQARGVHKGALRRLHRELMIHPA